MFKFVKKIFTRSVSQEDVTVLRIYATALKSLENMRDKMTTDDGRQSLDEKINNARTRLVNHLADMAKRGYIHDQIV